MTLRELPKQKQQIARAIFDSFSAISSVKSVTIVGSFCDGNELDAISDIDTVVICDSLDEALFQKCKAAITRLEGKDFGFPDASIRLNTTFGPLKLDDSETIVVHLMIYDVVSHRHHVLRSPFTCYDWERSVLNVGPSLRDIFPVLGLQPSDFRHARRGLGDYLSDLESGAISFRRYEFSDDGVPCEVTDSWALDSRHRGEYAVHIVRNIVANYLKLIRKSNQVYSHHEFLLAWKQTLPQCSWFIPEYEILCKLKRERALSYPEGTLMRVRQFVHDFHKHIDILFKGFRHVRFIRHAETQLNDGAFLGQRRDPSIKPNLEIQPFSGTYSRVYSSPARRATETAAFLSPGSTIQTDARIAEIDYGEVEGLHYHELQVTFPDITAAWERSEDPRFPKGENTTDVSERLASFLASLASDDGSALVVTHNVVLKCLLGMLFSVPKHVWHRLRVDHLAPLDVLLGDSLLIADIANAERATIADSLAQQGLENK